MGSIALTTSLVGKQRHRTTLLITVATGGPLKNRQRMGGEMARTRAEFVSNQPWTRTQALLIPRPVLAPVGHAVSDPGLHSKRVARGPGFLGPPMLPLAIKAGGTEGESTG